MHLDEDMLANKPKSQWKRLWLKHQFSIIMYFFFAIAVLSVWHFLSDGDFSFLMTLGSLFVAFAFGLLIVKIVVTHKVSNISLKTLQCYIVVFAARLSSILVYEGYLPFDKSGDWFYQAIEVVCLAMALGLAVAVAFVYSGSYGKAADKFGAGLRGLPNPLGALVLVVPALLLAMLLHPNLNGNWFTDTAWAWALYLEAVAIVPQLYMFQSAGRNAEVEPFEANFVFSVAMGRALHFVFWLSSYHELNDKYTDEYAKKYPGHLVVLSQIVNLLLMCDYIYYYMVSARSGQHFVLPSTI